LQKIIRGKAFVLGNNIDTDQIIPAEHLVYNMADEEESRKYGHFALSAAPLNQSGLPKGGLPFVVLRGSMRPLLCRRLALKR